MDTPYSWISFMQALEKWIGVTVAETSMWIVSVTYLMIQSQSTMLPTFLTLENLNGSNSHNSSVTMASSHTG